MAHLPPLPPAWGPASAHAMPHVSVDTMAVQQYAPVRHRDPTQPPRAATAPPAAAPATAAPLTRGRAGDAAPAPRTALFVLLVRAEGLPLDCLFGACGCAVTRRGWCWDAGGVVSLVPPPEPPCTYPSAVCPWHVCIVVVMVVELSLYTRV